MEDNRTRELAHPVLEVMQQARGFSSRLYAFQVEQYTELNLLHVFLPLVHLHHTLNEQVDHCSSARNEAIAND